jgi:hypothetical protein
MNIYIPSSYNTGKRLGRRIKIVDDIETTDKKTLRGMTGFNGGTTMRYTKTPSYLREKRPANTWNDKVKLATYYPKHGQPREMFGGKPE